MSLIVAVYVPTGMVLSGDSRTTGTILQQVADPQNPPNLISVQTKIVASDSANKLFLLHNRFGIGTWGDAQSNSLPIAHYIEEFKALSNPQMSILEFSQKLLEYFRSLKPILKTAFLICGYEDNEPYVFEVNIEANTWQRINLSTNMPNKLSYGIIRGGDTLIVDRLLSDKANLPLFLTMNLQDAIDYSRHLIRTTIDQMRFEPRFPSVGGFIETIVITNNNSSFLAKKDLYIS